jgi:hypothetical protein
VRPWFPSKHEADIDRHIDETRSTVGDVAVRYAAKATAYVKQNFAAVMASLQEAQAGGRVLRASTGPTLH